MLTKYNFYFHFNNFIILFDERMGIITLQEVIISKRHFNLLTHNHATFIFPQMSPEGLCKHRTAVTRYVRLSQS